MRTAQALAVNKNEKLSMEHLNLVLAVTEGFEHDLKGTGQLESMITPGIEITLADNSLNRYDVLCVRILCLPSVSHRRCRREAVFHLFSFFFFDTIISLQLVNWSTGT